VTKTELQSHLALAHNVCNVDLTGMAFGAALLPEPTMKDLERMHSEHDHHVHHDDVIWSLVAEWQQARERSEDAWPQLANLLQMLGEESGTNPVGDALLEAAQLIHTAGH
jgi:hypothetical protein